MSESLGPMTLGRKEHQVFLGRDISEDRNYSDEVAFQIDKAVEKIIENAYNRAKDILVKNKRKLKKIAEKLLEKETLEGEELDNLLKGAKLASGQPVIV
jgi:cell division protease FtsH